MMLMLMLMLMMEMMRTSNMAKIEAHGETSNMGSLLIRNSEIGSGWRLTQARGGGKLHLTEFGMIQTGRLCLLGKQQM